MTKDELNHVADVIERVQHEETDKILDLLHGTPWDTPTEAAADELRHALQAGRHGRHAHPRREPPCGYVNRAGDVTDCAPDHDSAEDIRARLDATGGYVMQPSALPEPMGLHWHGSDYRGKR